MGERLSVLSMRVEVLCPISSRTNVCIVNKFSEDRIFTNMVIR
jgi:hypothetical protein